MAEWVWHLADNLPGVAGQVPAMRLAGAFPGATAFVVGAGPSLDGNGHLLGDCRRKGLVFTVDVACGAFRRHGAEPHVFIAVEGKDMSAHFDGIGWIDTVPRAFSLEANPALLACGRGPLLPWADSNMPFNDVNWGLLGCEGLPIGGSATTAAMLLAEAWGCTRVVLVGQDLANTCGRRAADGVGDGLAVLEDMGVVPAWGTGLPIPDTEKRRLLELTPATYLGLAARLARSV
jgi:hypothetical protein